MLDQSLASHPCCQAWKATLRHILPFRPKYPILWPLADGDYVGIIEVFFPSDISTESL